MSGATSIERLKPGAPTHAPLLMPHGDPLTMPSWLETLPHPILVVEAIAQLAGGLAFREQRGHGFLSGIDGVTLDRPIEPGETVRFRVIMTASFGAIFRFTGTGTVEGVEVIRGKFYLAT